MRKILIIATSFPPVGERNCERVIKFCKYLPEFGYDPSVLTISKAGIRVFDHSLEEGLSPGLKIYRASFPTLSPAVTSLAARSRMAGFFLNFIKRNLFIPDDKITWILPAAIKGRRACRQNKISLILSSAPSFSSHLVAYLVKKMIKGKWVADYRDLWTGNPNYKVKEGLRRKIEIFLDRLIVKNADAIITVSEEWKAFIAGSFLKYAREKIFVIPNGYDLTDFENIIPEKSQDNRFVISHTGVLMPSYPTEELFEAIAGLDKPIKEKIRLNLFGYIYEDHKKSLEELSKKLNLEKIVHFAGSIPREEALKVQRSSDVLLLLYSGYGENIKGMIPSKVFDYIAAGKPILALLPECGAAGIIRKGNCGTLVEPRNIEDIRTALTSIYERRRSKIEKNYNWSYLKQFERMGEVKVLSDILNGLFIESSRKKILMIATDFPPNPSVGRLRTVKFCKFLPEFGWQPIVLAPSYRHFWGRDESLLKEIPAGTKVCRAFFPALIEIIACLITGRQYSKSHSQIRAEENNNKKGKSLLKKGALIIAKSLNRFFAKLFLIPDRYTLWLPFALFKALRINRKEKVEIIYTTIPAASLVLLGYMLKKILRKKWIIDYRDLWSGDHTREQAGSLRKKVEKFLEKNLSPKADLIITTSRQKVDYLRTFFTKIDPSRIICITNGFDPDDYPVALKERGNDGRFVVTYTGRLYRKLSALSFLHALGMAINENSAIKDRITVRFIGDIFKEEKEKLDAAVRKFDLAKLVDFIGYVNYEESLRYQSHSDLLLLIMGNAENADGVIPTKVFEYLGSKKPILAIVPHGAAEEIVKQTGSGIASLPDDINMIKNAFLTLYERYGNGNSNNFSLNHAVVDRFSRRNLTKDLSVLLSGILS